jgi:hypothetical protein
MQILNKIKPIKILALKIAFVGFLIALFGVVMLFTGVIFLGHLFVNTGLVVCFLGVGIGWFYKIKDFLDRR